MKPRWPGAPEEVKAVAPAPEQAHEAQLLGQSVVDLVLRVPVVNLPPPGQRGRSEQLHHLQGLPVRGTDHLSKDPCAQPGHAHGVGRQTGHDELRRQKHGEVRSRVS